MGSQKTSTMLFRHLLLLALVTLAVAQPFSSKQDANTFLRVKRRARNWTRKSSFKHKEAWNEYKDELEEMSEIPEEEVDALENCIGEAEDADEWCDNPISSCKSHEELEEAGHKTPIFPQCFAKVPRHAPSSYRPR